MGDSGKRTKSLPEHLRQAEDIFEHALDAMVAMDSEGRITGWNPQSEVIFGWSKTEAVGRLMSETIIPERFRQQHEIGFRRFLSTGEGPILNRKIEISAIHRNGQEFPVELAVTPVKTENGYIFYGFVSDISERKAAQENLRKTNEQMRFLSEATKTLLADPLNYEARLEHLAHAVVPHLADWCAIDMRLPDGSIDYSLVYHQDPLKLRAALDIRRKYPLQPDDVIGAAKVMRTGKPEWRAQVSDEMLQAIAVNNEHLQFLRSIGLSSYICVPLTARGQILGALSLASAESGRSYTEDDVALASELAHRAAIAADNARLYREAQEAIRIRDEFLSIASHELKTPLTSMKLQGQMLDRALKMRQLSEVPAAKVEKLIRANNKQLDRLSQLVEELLDVTSIQAGRLPVHKKLFDLNELIRDVVEKVTAQCEKAQCDIRLDLAEDIKGEWDPSRIEQVILNLISNALKYGPGKPIHISTRLSEKHAIITVRDQGIGIDQEQLQTVFERFKRAVPASDYGGLGLGLYIVKQIVDAHDGLIEVESVRGQGATFRVTLPLQPPAPGVSVKKVS